MRPLDILTYYHGLRLLASKFRRFHSQEVLRFDRRRRGGDKRRRLAQRPLDLRVLDCPMNCASEIVSAAQV